MNAAIEALLDEVDRLKRALRNGPGKQIQADSECEKIRQLCGFYFDARREIAETDDAAAADGLFKQLHSMARGHPGRAKAADMLAKARKLLVALEGAPLRLRRLSLQGGRRRPTSSSSIHCGRCVRVQGRPTPRPWKT